MDKFRFLNLIPVLEAQELDAVSQPTFGPIEVAGGGGTANSILIRSDKTAVNQGDTFTITVAINTNSLTVSEYRVVLKYDETKFSVINDADINTEGTQVLMLDTVFVPENPATDNIVSGGLITIYAKSQSSSAFELNKDVAQITFQAQNTGTGKIEVTKGTGNSKLTRLSGAELAFNINEISFDVGNVATTPTPTVAPTNIAGGTTPTPTFGSGTLPDTGIFDNNLTGVLIGVMLLLIGLSIGKKKGKIAK